jgi:hypothetical protein
MPGYLAKIAGMASSSKGRRVSSSKQSSTAKARVISAKRTDPLPLKGNVSTSRRKPIVQAPIDAPLEPLAAAVVRPKKKASRTKTSRAAGRASGELKKPAATKPGVEALAFVETEVETETEVDVSAIVEEATIIQAPPPLPIEAVSRPAPASPAPAAPAPHHRKRALVTVVAQMFSALRRWTGVR